MKRRALLAGLCALPLLPAFAVQKRALLDAHSTLAQVLAHPAFTGFAERLLPWPGRAYDPQLPLARAGELMPYHSHFHAPDMVDALNAMILQDAPVFYELYDAAARSADAQKAHTGIFHFMGKAGAPTALIAPGGGFQYVGSLHEGFPIAKALADQGINAVVLKYRVGAGGRNALEDMAAAIDFLFARQTQMGLSMRNYSVWGASAGARMAAHTGTYGAGSHPRPAAVIMLYSGHSDYGAHEPPTFIAVGERDGIAPPAIMQRRADMLKKQGVPVEMHVYPQVGHGFALGTGTSAAGWLDKARDFWRRHDRERKDLPSPDADVDKHTAIGIPS